MKSEQVVIVTGASNGIGREIGKAYVEKGAQVSKVWFFRVTR